MGAGSYRRPGDGHKNFLSRTGTGRGGLTTPLKCLKPPNLVTTSACPCAGITVMRGKDFVFEKGRPVRFTGVDKHGNATQTIYIWE